MMLGLHPWPMGKPPPPREDSDPELPVLRVSFSHGGSLVSKGVLRCCLCSDLGPCYRAPQGDQYLCQKCGEWSLMELWARIQPS